MKTLYNILLNASGKHCCIETTVALWKLVAQRRSHRVQVFISRKSTAPTIHPPGNVTHANTVPEFVSPSLHKRLHSLRIADILPSNINQSMTRMIKMER